MKDVAKFYKNENGATIFINRGFAKKIGFNNKEKLLIDYNEKENIISLKRL